MGSWTRSGLSIARSRFACRSRRRVPSRGIRDGRSVCLSGRSWDGECSLQITVSALWASIRLLGRNCSRMNVSTSVVHGSTFYDPGSRSAAEQHVVVSASAYTDTSMLHQDRPLMDDHRGVISACRASLHSELRTVYGTPLGPGSKAFRQAH